MVHFKQLPKGTCTGLPKGQYQKTMAGPVSKDFDEGSMCFVPPRKIRQSGPFKLRIIFLSISSLIALGLCLAVAIGGRKNETAKFEKEFRRTGETVVIAFVDRLNQRLDSLQSFARELTADAEQDQSTSWPYKTFPGFAYRASDTAKLADAIYIQTAPRVEEDTLASWNSFAEENQNWIAASIFAEHDGELSNVSFASIPPMMLGRDLNGTFKIESGPGPYFPLWQSYPVVDSDIINTNVYSSEENVAPLNLLLRTNQPVVPASFDFWGLEYEDPRRGVFNRFLRTYEKFSGPYQNDAVTTMFVPSEYPVFVCLQVSAQSFLTFYFSL